ncbi:iojap-like protein [Thermoclostridium stercorarium subsp. stercorarium DSM 8532]|jgi:ribosome-associated protein|uniref:Ribosomal silencing factor RsfS n=2 Tax=Thermoclostridium stercorarium TaxID=1510 RepID=L7VM09_THES1|nr:ribosome silencing factor [Thermoclostridium stercorarium]AGC67644.1 iojap-like protein [Thermoclostridium stercorarium subsp. stercorarium DSM 8532]AGI38691.1 ribosome-associated protein [Thermoclostridium stercorarium subsp. stercorarium DSM 8532]ANW98061.1 ribosome silencing factor RsfS [Thermoclostridium stercorarium subsp. thermolacticum DSM 2910]
MEFTEMYDEIVAALEEKKAKELTVIDIRNLTTIATYFIICSGTSTTHIKALADEVEFRLKEKGVSPHRIEGYNNARWILMDYGEIVVHIFHEEDRRFYNLERLWQDGRAVPVKNAEQN